jgi:hypothetical protein
MNLKEVFDELLPGELEHIRQAWRQGYDWRKALHRMRPAEDTDDAGHRARIDEIGDVLERDYFPTLVTIVRHEHRGQPPVLKGSARRGEITVRRRG